MKPKNTEIRAYTIGKTHFAECKNIRFGKIAGTITMTGSSQEIAKKKLMLSLENKPYGHLDKIE